MKISVVMPLLIMNERQRLMTEFSMQLLWSCTRVPFQLVVVETESRAFDPQYLADFTNETVREAPKDCRRHEYARIPHKGNFSKDLNAAIAMCSGTHIVFTSNDVFVRDGWLEALMEPFQRVADCGVSTQASTDLPHPYSTKKEGFIMEGAYGPHMMVPAQFPDGSRLRFDESFTDIFIDTDMMMTWYGMGKRCYRSHSSTIDHLNKGTWGELHSPEEQAERLNAAKARFMEKHGPTHGHLRAYDYFVSGHLF